MKTNPQYNNAKYVCFFHNFGGHFDNYLLHFLYCIQSIDTKIFVFHSSSFIVMMIVMMRWLELAAGKTLAV